MISQQQQQLFEDQNQDPSLQKTLNSLKFENSHSASKNDRLSAIQKMRLQLFKGANRSHTVLPQPLPWKGQNLQAIQKMVQEKYLQSLPTNESSNNNNNTTYVLTVTLFEISRAMTWRNYSTIIELLLHLLQNLIAQNPQHCTQQFQNVPNFQDQVEYICCLGSSKIQSHLLQFLQSLVMLQSKYGNVLTNLTKLAMNMLPMLKRGGAVAEGVMWLYCELPINTMLLTKLVDHKYFVGHELQFMTMVANWIADCASQNKIEECVGWMTNELVGGLTIIQQLLENPKFSGSLELIRETQLVLNNFMSLDSRSTTFVMQHMQNKVEGLLSIYKNEESYVTIVILWRAGFLSREQAQGMVMNLMGVGVPCNTQIGVNDLIRSQLI